jgi:hypothetical protein
MRLLYARVKVGKNQTNSILRIFPARPYLSALTEKRVKLRIQLYKVSPAISPIRGLHASSNCHLISISVVGAKFQPTATFFKLSAMARSLIHNLGAT